MNPLIHFPQIAIFGQNLIGAAIGMAARRIKIADKIIGIAFPGDESKQDIAAMGAVDELADDLEKAARDADFFIFALSPAKTLAALSTVSKIVKKGCLLTDVGSVKKEIVDKASALFQNDTYFVGSHLMIGVDQSGLENAPNVEFQGKTAFVTIDSHTDQKSAARVAFFWKALGMIPVMIDPEKHDLYSALVRVLPHLSACALLKILSEAPDDLNFIRQTAGKDFISATRSAGGDAAMVIDPLMQESPEMTKALDRLILELEKIRTAAQTKDRVSLEILLKTASDFHAQLRKIHENLL